MENNSLSDLLTVFLHRNNLQKLSFLQPSFLSSQTRPILRQSIGNSPSYGQFTELTSQLKIIIRNVGLKNKSMIIGLSFPFLENKILKPEYQILNKKKVLNLGLILFSGNKSILRTLLLWKNLQFLTFLQSPFLSSSRDAISISWPWGLIIGKSTLLDLWTDYSLLEKAVVLKFVVIRNKNDFEAIDGNRQSHTTCALKR